MSTNILDRVKELRDRTGAGMMDCKAALEATSGDIEKAIDALRKKGLAQVSKRAGREAKEGLIAGRVEGQKAALVEVNCETDFVARTEDFSKLVALALQETFARGDGACASEGVSQRVAELTGKIGEKIVARRGRRIESSGGSLHVYIHSNNKLGVIVELGVQGGASAHPALEELGKNLAMQVAAANPICLERSQMPAAVLERETAIFREEIKGKPENIVEKILQGKLDKFYQANCLIEQPFIRDDKTSVRKLVEQASAALGKAVEIRSFVRYQLGETVSA